jgi:hypothetical protein
MSAPVVPTKTALGQEELRRRAGGLGQRHRTILFLIDGRRPLSEVLSLAQQAGSTTVHFEDLVRLGYVQLPPEELPPVTLYPPIGASAEAAELTHVELTVPGDDAPTGPMPMPVAETVIVPMAPILIEPRALQPVEPSVPGAGAPEPASTAPTAPTAPPAAVTVAAPAAPVAPPPVRSPVAQAVATLVDDEDNQPLAVVRRCLLETLRLDLTPFSFRAQARVRAAQDHTAMVELVWQIEADLPHSRRSHAGMLSLQRARDLLGLGNTLVDEDSQAGRLDEDDW